MFHIILWLIAGIVTIISKNTITLRINFCILWFCYMFWLLVDYFAQ